MNTIVGIGIFTICVGLAYLIREKLTLSKKIKNVVYAILAIIGTIALLLAYVVIS